MDELTDQEYELLISLVRHEKDELNYRLTTPEWASRHDLVKKLENGWREIRKARQDTKETPKGPKGCPGRATRG